MRIFIIFQKDVQKDDEMTEMIFFRARFLIL